MLYKTTNPATEEVVQTFPTIGDAELEAAITTADSFYRNDWRNRSIGERVQILNKAAQILTDRAEEFAKLITLEMGKLTVGALSEVRLTAGILSYYAKHAESFLSPKRIDGIAHAEVVTKPLGVLLAVEPWNFPYYQLVRVAAPQLAAGNVVLLKHAENVPQCALAFERMLLEAGLPKGGFTNLFASHEQIAKVIADPRIVGVTVTGSERAGSAIAEQAGRHLKKVVMELGGSDALIVLPDASLEHAVGGALFGRTFNAGQSCVATKRIIVIGKERGKSFIEEFVAKVKGLKLGDPSESSTQLGPVSSERALDGLLDQINQARSGGAEILTGGTRANRPGYFLEPTVITGIEETNPVYRQELFGPVASIYVVDDEEAAIRLANDTPYGLGGSVFGDDVDNARRVADRIESGMVFVNQPAQTRPELPFGGIKNSGFGRELSEMGIGEFVNRKLIHLAPAGAPPFGPVELKKP
ncbi:NAD-dependent succinate-semialdehyde dehydrogenase [Paraburkholderia sp. 22B1P]|uniref:NAD-dependent succinate-semialdehyde dehydrogenase n=1 Tax=Paraburkholderia sp. 22B1P TaxID=3080498 RepID=UPI0030920D44|nr:NAD-dependent succinate-semialdehyde dehydrogenase [Paraburkholderia sp. 22B1P]